MNKNVTIVTGLWDMGRANIDPSFSRGYGHYLEKFAQLLTCPNNMVIYVDPADEEFVWKHRSPENTYIRSVSLEDFRSRFEFYDKVQQIRIQPEWYTQAGWLANSPQATLEYYNPVVMSKIFMLNDATFYNPFDSTHFYWIDAGITNTVHPGYFNHDGVFDNLETYSTAHEGMTLLAYPYDGAEIHGFPTDALSQKCGSKVAKVCRGGFFGGSKKAINEFNTIYHGHLRDTLHEGLMGTEETIFTLVSYLHPELVNVFDIGDDGMVWPFFEAVKDVSQFVGKKISSVKLNSTMLYVLGFNSPNQFRAVCESIAIADPDMWFSTKKVLINNSTDESTFEEYDSLCGIFDFEEIHRENLGVCGGRQFAAEHFATTDAEYSIFFEDDMFLNPPDELNETCTSGFKKYVPNLYKTVLAIMNKEKYDFLKFSFSEFYLNNNLQVAWYNVPQDVRTRVWPDYDKLPEFGFDLNGPKTKISGIGTMNGVPYASGEIYYGNWPQIVSKAGNQRMFLDTTWARPYEQTWMSHMFQLTLENKLSPGILLASPVTHNRFQFYADGLRKES